MDWVKRNRLLLLIVGFAILHLVVYSVVFGFRPNNDTDSFVWTIERFRGGDSPLHPNRYLNPFYPIVGVTVFRFLSPVNSLIFTNIIFYVAMILATYGLFRRVFARRLAGVAAVLLLVPAYPLLRYGLTQVQDIGGYAWFVIGVYTAWRWRETKAVRFLWAGGAAVSLGMLTKESGSMSALFMAGLLLEHLFRSGLKPTIKAGLVYAILPAFTLVVNQWRGKVLGYSSYEWLMDNWRIYAHEYTFFKWFGIHLTTFNAWLLLAAIGAYLLWRHRATLSVDIKVYLAAIFLPSLSYLGWPIFMSRTVFIAAWFVLPLAIYPLIHWYDAGKKWFVGGVIAFCMVIPYLLQMMLGYMPVFLIMQGCSYRPICIVETILKVRSEFDDFHVGSERIIEKHQ